MDKQAVRFLMLNRKFRNQSGWSLIELIIAIAIALVLVSLMVMTYSQMRMKAHEARCVSNLKHVGAAFLLYTLEQNDGVIRANIHASNLEMGWTRLIVNEGYLDRDAPWEVLHCPTANIPETARNAIRVYNPASPNLGKGDVWRWYTYGLNMCRIPGVTEFPIRYHPTYKRDLKYYELPMNRIENPANHLLIADSSSGAPNHWPTQSMERDNPRGLGLRHGPRDHRYAYAFFVDGHVEQVTRERAEFLATARGNYGFHIPKTFIFDIDQ